MKESIRRAFSENRPDERVLGAETELLLCCGHYSADSDHIDRAQKLLSDSELDWQCLFATARLHRVVPLLYHSLNRIGTGLVPQDFLADLHQYHLSNTARNLFLTGELLSLLKMFEEAGISAAPFKGPILASLAYGNVSWREFDDLDILVPQEHVLRAVGLLESQGYSNTLTLTEQEKAGYLNSGCEFTLMHDKTEVTIDLHWKFVRDFYSFPFDTRGLWQRLEPLSVAGRPILAMPLEETLLLHCVHGSKHQWERLEWISVLAQLARVHHTRIDSKRLLSLARSLGSERMLLLGFALVRRFFGAPVPEMLLRRFSSHPSLDSLIRWVGARLFFEGDEHLLEGQKHLFHVKMRENWRDRIPYFLRLLSLLKQKLTPNQRDQELVPLPAALSFLHYLSRPIRLCWEYGKQSVTSLQGLLRRFHSR